MTTIQIVHAIVSILIGCCMMAFSHWLGVKEGIKRERERAESEAKLLDQMNHERAKTDTVVQRNATLHETVVSQALMHGYSKGIGLNISPSALSHWLMLSQREKLERLALAHGQITASKQIEAANLALDAISTRITLDSALRNEVMNCSVIPALSGMRFHKAHGTNQS